MTQRPPTHASSPRPCRPASLRRPSGARPFVALAGLAVACLALACASEHANPDRGSGGAGGSRQAAGGAGSGGKSGLGGSLSMSGAAGQSGNGGVPGSGGAAGSSATSGAAGSATSGAAGRVASGGDGSGATNAGGSSGNAPLGGRAGGDGMAGVSGNAAGGAGSSQGGSGSGAGSGPLGPVTLFLAGDSTVSTYRDTASETDQAGWGQMLGALFDDRVTVENRAVGGMTARHFIENGYLDEIFEELQPGDYLLVQFGTNDGNRTATYMLNGQTIPYYLDPATDFKTYLRQYVDGALERGATPVFVTPPPRNSAYCTGGNGTGGHATAMRELGLAMNISVSDLNAKSVAYLQAICPAPTPEDFFLLRADGSVDGTHFQEHGARVLASLVAEGIAQANLPLAAYLR